MTIILYCPHCGNTPDKEPYNIGGIIHKRFAIWCPCCEYSGPVGSSPELAIAAWNERHSPYQAEIEQLKKELAALRAEKIYKERNR